MLTVDDFSRIRCAARDGMSIREMARRFGHSRKSVRKALANPEPKLYTLTQARDAPVLGRYYGVIDQILADDQQAPRKQRHTAAQIYRHLCGDPHHSLPGQLRPGSPLRGQAPQAQAAYVYPPGPCAGPTS